MPSIPKIFIPSYGPEDWRRFLAQPEKHWAAGYSALMLAECWEAAQGFPVEVRRMLEHQPVFKGIEPLLIFPEWKVPLPGGSRASQCDIWILAHARQELISIAVEGKVGEPFDKTLMEWSVNASPGKVRRLSFLSAQLGLQPPLPEGIRYQLLHRAVAAILEARRFGASQAVMLVHSFSQTQEHFSDFAAFVNLFGETAEAGQSVRVNIPGGLALHLGWVQGAGPDFSPESLPPQ